MTQQEQQPQPQQQQQHEEQHQQQQRLPSRPAQVYHVQSALSDSQSSGPAPLSHTTSNQPSVQRQVRLEVPRSDSPDGLLDATPAPPIIEHLSHSHRRMRTNLEQAPVETRLSVKYFVRRPMARFIHYDGKTYKAGNDGAIELVAWGEHGENHGKSSTEYLNIQRERLDLFLDLLWVGIISNISEIFFTHAFKSDADVGNAFDQFILLFLPTWSFWVRTQAWLNLFFLDDFVQRFLILWLLVLALIWGNNAPAFLQEDDGNTWLIASYLIGLASMKAMELIYCIWIPWIRRQFIVETALFVPASVMWALAASFDNSSDRYNFVSAAVAYEWAYTTILNSPLGDSLLGKQFRKAQDNQHTIERYGNFFILALGEGVFLLIRNSPLGQGLTQATGVGVQALVIYYFIALTYFRGDHSKRIVPAQHRSWYIRNFWGLFHVPLFCALVLLSSGTLYLVEYALDNDPVNASAPANGEERRRAARGRLWARDDSASPIELDQNTFRVALTTTFVALAVAYASMLVLAMLNRSVDEGEEDGEASRLVVQNRYLRMAPRVGAIIAFATMWLYPFTEPQTVIAWAVLITWFVYMWEGVGGMERWPGFFEPRNKHIRTPTESGFSSSRD